MGTLPSGPLTELAMVTGSPRETQALGALLGRLAEPGDVILLVGPLGAGKTCLVQGLARGLGVHEYVTSPTFTIIREYQGTIPLYHVDCFRIETPGEAQDLGLDDYFGGRGLCVVEWADKVVEAVPSEHLMITLDYRGEKERALRLEGRGARYEELLVELERRLGTRGVTYGQG
ncbi:MAG TPA: tRNA (adenosine(37)-N6)-threonylcarbamoyltransferase complex ATPase subunit type 1 TsaE [Dehalococcoidia bacterium]|nr:tRNA (adenosine(37)-N6)-threonylcarbamoyltransferase complex ATPase subunit type 1 TsaE [Dehalococcoidia bacterium]